MAINFGFFCNALIPVWTPFPVRFAPALLTVTLKEYELPIPLLESNGLINLEVTVTEKNQRIIEDSFQK